MPPPFTLAVSPRLRSTPFHDRVVAAGAKACTIYNHMLLPVTYESLEADYRHLVERVQLWDVSAERQVEVRGRDALALVARRATPPARRLERVVIAGERIEPNTACLPLHAGGRDAGHVTSAVYSPRLERNVALAMVLTEREAGAALRVTLEDGSERAAAVAGDDWSVSSGLRIGV